MYLVLYIDSSIRFGIKPSSLPEHATSMATYEREGNSNELLMFVHRLGRFDQRISVLGPQFTWLSYRAIDWSGHGTSDLPVKTTIDTYVEDCEGEMLRLISH